MTAEVGRIGTAGLFAIQDETAGIFIRLPAGVASPSRGGWIQFSGVLAVPYGQLEVRGSATGFRVLGTGPLPAAVAVSGSAVAEATEARLVVIEGVVKAKPKRASGGDMSLDLVTAGGTARVMADASSGLTVNALERGRTYRLSGVVGQRESGKKRDDGHRLWLRDAADIAVVAGSSPSPSAPGAPLASPGDDPRPIAEARLVRSGAVSIEATVTAGSALLDATGRRIVVEDASGAIEVLLPTGTVAPEPGSRVGLSGTVVRAYGAPRLRASAVRVLGSGRLPSPLQLHAAPGSAHEWRLVRLSGTLADVHRLGDRWRAEIVAGRDRVPVSGLSGAGIPAPSSAEGRPITVTGIVRRPFPSASDRRFAIVPRGPADLAVGPAPGGAGPAPAGAGASRPGSRSDTGSSPADVDLARLADHVGRTVRVGGLVIDLQADGVSLDDGTAVGRVVLASAAADYLPLLEPGDAVNATGRVERRAAGIVVVVTDPAGLARVGDLGTPVEPPHGPTPGPSRGPGPRLAATADPFGFDGPGATGLAWLVLISVASAAVTLLRRRRLRRAVLERVRIRLTGPGRRPTDGSLPPGAD